MEKKELAERIVEYASNYHWNLEGWGDNVPEDDDLEKELTGIVTFVFEELDKARAEGREEQAELDRSIYGMSFEEFNKKYKPVSKLKDNK